MQKRMNSCPVDKPAVVLSKKGSKVVKDSDESSFNSSEEPDMSLEPGDE